MTDAAPPKSAPAAGTGARVVHGIIAVVAAVLLVLIGARGGAMLNAAALRDLIFHHGSAVIGVPLAAMVATLVVSGLRAIDGALRFNLFGVQADGAGAGLLGWLAVFSAIAVAIRALW